MTRCHSVFSCMLPSWPFHCRLVAIDSVATRPPFWVLRTSGSAPRLPIRMTLFKLRLTAPSTSLGVWSRRADQARIAPGCVRLSINPTPGAVFLRQAAEPETQHQRVLARVVVVLRAHSHRPEARILVEQLRRPVRLAHLEE